MGIPSGLHQGQAVPLCGRTAGDGQEPAPPDSASGVKCPHRILQEKKGKKNSLDKGSSPKYSLLSYGAFCLLP